MYFCAIFTKLLKIMKKKEDKNLRWAAGSSSSHLSKTVIEFHAFFVLIAFFSKAAKNNLSTFSTFLHL